MYSRNIHLYSFFVYISLLATQYTYVLRDIHDRHRCVLRDRHNIHDGMMVIKLQADRCKQTCMCKQIGASRYVCAVPASRYVCALRMYVHYDSMCILRGYICAYCVYAAHVKYAYEERYLYPAQVKCTHLYASVCICSTRQIYTSVYTSQIYTCTYLVSDTRLTYLPCDIPAVWHTCRVT